MSYPPPPGISSLPARPPASNNKSGFKPAAFKPAFTPTSVSRQQPPPSYSSNAAAGSSRSNYGGFVPSSVQQGSAYQSYPGSGGAVTASAGAYSYQQQQQQQQPPQQQQQQAYGQQAYSGAPQIRNPFPLPGTGPAPSANAHASDYDPEMAAQIAQWQSAYLPKDAVGKDGKPLAPEIPKPEVAAPVNREITVARNGGGKKWTDDTLLEWDPAHLRLFIGNLAGETTDESLLKAFSRWQSVQKARVIRDKRTNKSKGYGFVSFSDADDFFQAAKEMNGKYIQSHPVTVRKANTEIKVTNVKEKHYNNKKKNRHGGSGYDQRQSEQSSQLGPKSGGGVTKPGQKTKNGLKLLG